MRTNIDIDDKLMAEAMAATRLETTRKVVEAAAPGPAKAAGRCPQAVVTVSPRLGGGAGWVRDRYQL
jgi:hypothetical protein